MSGFVLKMIALIGMTVDHMGVLLFPGAFWLRGVGRLAYPIFAYFIAEGFWHTHNRLRYFLRIFAVAILCQAVYGLFGDPFDMCIFVTFSLSLILMGAAERTRAAFAEKRDRRAFLWLALFIGLLIATYLFCWYFTVDYSFAGIVTPLLVSFFKNKWARLASLTVGLLWIAIDTYLAIHSLVSLFALLTLPLLALYNGKPGRCRMKYFFYLYYPLHLAVLQLIAWIIA